MPVVCRRCGWWQRFELEDRYNGPSTEPAEGELLGDPFEELIPLLAMASMANRTSPTTARELEN
jgi:hypothetical protein